jgi:DNA-binding beta-propeller fold protein YncE
VFFLIAVSFNQPKFCPSATWNATGTTFANSTFVGSYPYGIFVNINNTVYVAAGRTSLIKIWFEGNNIPTTINATVYSYMYIYSLFVTITDDIYININDDVEKWSLNSGSNFSTLNTGGMCFGLFIDSNNSLYCSLYSLHEVIKRSLNSTDYQTTIVAGSSCPGFLPNKLNYPEGIFVDTNFNLYVADSNNQRIQMFQSGQLNATTAAGNGAPGTITLSYPTDVILDADGYLFIVDSDNQRIIGSGPAGFRCVVGCSGAIGSGSNQLFYPQNMAFDSYGNIFVVDCYNNRIQKFLLVTNSCSKYHIICECRIDRKR